MQLSYGAGVGDVGELESRTKSSGGLVDEIDMKLLGQRWLPKTMGLLDCQRGTKPWICQDHCIYLALPRYLLRKDFGRILRIDLFELSSAVFFANLFVFFFPASSKFAFNPSVSGPLPE